MYELDKAVVRGHINTVAALAQYCSVDNILTAIKYGHLYILQILCMHHSLPVGAHILAIKYGHMHIVQWIHCVYNLFIMYGNPLYTAICNGHIDIAIWLINIGCITEIHDAVVVAGLMRHVDMVDWVIDNSLDSRSCYDLAALHGDMNMLKLAKKNPNSCIRIEDNGAEIAALWAAANGHLEVLKYMNDSKFVYSVKLMKYAIISGNLKMVQWLYPNYEKKNSLINDAIYNGKLEILQWMYYEKPNEVIFQVSTVTHAVKCGYTEMIKWIFSCPHKISTLHISRMYKNADLYGHDTMRAFLHDLIV